MPRIPCPTCGASMNISAGHQTCAKCRKGRPVYGTYMCECCHQEKTKTKRNPGPVCARCFRKDQPCTMPGCEVRNYAGDGLCWPHYRKKNRHGAPDAITTTPCEWEGCPKTTRNPPEDGYTLCHRHRQNFQRNGGRARNLTPEERSAAVTGVAKPRDPNKPKRERKPRDPNAPRKPRKRRKARLWTVEELTPGDACWVWHEPVPMVYEAKIDGSTTKNPIAPVVHAWLESGLPFEEIVDSYVWPGECNNGACVRPAHQHIQSAPKGQFALNSLCSQGHWMTQDTRGEWETGEKQPYCKSCRVLALAKAKARKQLLRRAKNDHTAQ